MKIVSFSKVVPYEGVPHAGGEYYLHHIESLASDYEITIIAPNTARNREAKERFRLPARVFLVNDIVNSPGRKRFLRKVLDELRPVSAPAYLHRALRTDHDLRQIVRDANIAEFQWSESASVIGRVKRINSDARRIVVMHDVLQQKFRRRLATANTLKPRARALIGFVSARILEPRRLLLGDDVIVFSKKDKQLIESAVGPDRIFVIPPPLQFSNAQKVPSRTPFSVLFTGAMDRPENDLGIRWFIKNCWPSILSQHPGARLTIAGAAPSQELLELASGYHSISVTGYVDSLDPFYASASVFVVPLFQGAGVKFKAISAMLHGVPIVSTVIGAEGVAPTSFFGAVTNDAESFTKAVNALLGGGPLWQEVSETSQEWALRNYGMDVFHNALKRAYARVENSVEESHEHH